MVKFEDFFDDRYRVFNHWLINSHFQEKGLAEIH